MAASWSVEREFFRLLNRIVEPPIRAGWASPRFVPGGLIVLETIGRRSSRRARVPLAAIRIDGHVLVSTFRGGRSEWVKNASANPRVRYWLRGRPRQATALVISSRRRGGYARLPAAVRWLVRALLPYTYAGWAFAVLVPERRAAGNERLTPTRWRAAGRAGTRRDRRAVSGRGRDVCPAR
jgi:deazaflavin-dependent oxidoreductase (nitroreductase family)